MAEVGTVKLPAEDPTPVEVRNITTEMLNQRIAVLRADAFRIEGMIRELTQWKGYLEGTVSIDGG